MTDRQRPSITAVADAPVVALCAGKDCRKRPEFAKVRRGLEPRGGLVEVECVGICAGPVVVVDPNSAHPLVLAKLRSKQHRRDLLRFVDAFDHWAGTSTRCSPARASSAFV